jgi:3-isopropylmalate/(R)-2-methylmalate dehydratase small subunit
MNAAIRLIRSASLVLAQANIDTDRIIPARFLSTTTRTGLGQYAFADWRRKNDGSDDPDFVLNRPENHGRAILIAGRNFGCGSSREHAPWALVDAGIRAVVSSQVADIFRANALKNGLVPVVLDEAVVQALMRRPDDRLEIDIAAGELRTPAGEAHRFELDAFARTCLLEGVDELGYLLARAPDITRYETRQTPEFRHGF